MSNNHEDQRDSLNKYTIDLTERALSGKLDPVIDVMMRSAVPFRSCHAVLKITQYSLVNLG